MHPGAALWCRVTNDGWAVTCSDLLVSQGESSIRLFVLVLVLKLDSGFLCSLLQCFSRSQEQIHAMFQDVILACRVGGMYR